MARRRKYRKQSRRKKYTRRRNHCGRPHKKYTRRRNLKTNTGSRAITVVQALRMSPRKLGSKLQEWHGGGGSGLYAVGSTLAATGKLPTDAAYVAAAIRELLNLKKDAKFPETVTAGDIQETKALATAIRMLQRKGVSENPPRPTRRNPRFMNEDQLKELINLWHLSNVPTSGTKGNRRYERMIWTAKWFHQKYPSISQTAAYKELDSQIKGYGWNPGDDGILYETKHMYVVKSKGRFEIRLNKGTHAVVVGRQPTLAKAKTTMDRLEKYPKQLHAFHS